MREHLRTVASVLGGAVLIDGALGALIVGLAMAWRAVSGVSGITWVLGRAAGLTSYVLLVLLVASGLVMTHPWFRRLPARLVNLSVHTVLATFTLIFTVLHVVVLALDPWAHVGWAGALLPLASSYRPVPVTLGVLALWAGLLTGVSARWAGRVTARFWWPVHRVASGIVVLVWAHAVLAGTDTGLLRGFYLASGAALLGLAVTRYGAASPRDQAGALARDLRPVPVGLEPRQVRVPGSRAVPSGRVDR